MCYSNELNKPNIMVITHPFTSISGDAKLTSFIDVLRPISKEIFLITGNVSYESKKRIHIVRIKSVNQNESMFIWAFKQMLIQLRACINILKISKNIDLAIFYLGARTYLLSLLLAKMLGIKTIVIVAGSAPQITRQTYAEMLFGIGGKIISRVSGVLEKFNYTLSDRIGIAMESESIIHQLGLQRYRSKISPFGSYYLDYNFKMKKKFSERENIIGYVGRLSGEKGVLELAKAIPLILSKKGAVKFLIVGDGPLMTDMKRELEGAGCIDKVEFVGWIPHEQIPDYLNEMRVHILPSYIEAFGGTAIEAMACGAISIANSVGGLPDVIEDGNTGFLLKDNLPQMIADKVIEVWKHPELERIQTNAKEFVEKTFSYEKAIEKCKKVFSGLYN